MTAGNDFDQDVQVELFSALLTPHRSLNHTGFLVIMPPGTRLCRIAGARGGGNRSYRQACRSAARLLAIIAFDDHEIALGVGTA